MDWIYGPEATAVALKVLVAFLTAVLAILGYDRQTLKLKLNAVDPKRDQTLPPWMIAASLILVVLAVVWLALAGTTPRPEPAPMRALAAGDSNFTNLVASGDISSGDDLSVGDDADIVGDLDANTWLRYTIQTPLSITNDSWVTPTGTFQPLHALVDIGISRISTASHTAGDLLILYNDWAGTIVITDENETHLVANRTLTTAGALTLIYSGTGWYEVGGSP